jgi:hypothetical protein
MGGWWAMARIGEVVMLEYYFMINPCFYYYLAAPHLSDRLLTAAPKPNSKGFSLTVEDEQEDSLSQLWMVKSADLEDVYYMHHCQSGLVLELGKEQALDLHHFKSKPTQRFKLNHISTQKMEFTISEYAKGEVLFIREDSLVCDSTSGGLETVWVLRRARKNKVLSTSVVLENRNSGFVLEAVGNAEKEEALLEQGIWRGMFSQRWQLEKCKDFYLLRNLKSSMVATVRQKKSKDGVEIVQEKEQDTHRRHQLWSIEERGHRIFTIRLASEQDLFLGTKSYTKEQSGVVLVAESSHHLWRIISLQAF